MFVGDNPGVYPGGVYSPVYPGGVYSPVYLDGVYIRVYPGWYVPGIPRWYVPGIPRVVCTRYTQGGVYARVYIPGYTMPATVLGDTAAAVHG